MQDAIAVQSLKTDIALLRQHVFPPQYLEHVEGLPIYYGLQEEVLAYYQQWKDLIERAQELFQPFMEDELPDAIHLPSHLNLPLFFFMWTVFGLIKHAQKNRKLSVVWRVLLKNVGSLKQIRYLPCKNGCRVTTQQH